MIFRSIKKGIVLMAVMALAFTATAKWEYSPVVKMQNPAATMPLQSVQDPQYNFMLGNPGTWNNTFTNLYSRGVISLHLDRATTKFLSTTTTIKAIVELKGYDPNGNPVHTSIHELVVKYDPNHNVVETDIASAVAEGFYKYTVSLIDLQFNNVSRSPISTDPDFFLELNCETERAYVLDPAIATLPAFQGSQQFIAAGACDYDIELSWMNVPAAEAYELEWMFIDLNNTNLSSYPYTFRHNSSRIRVEENSAHIPLVYEAGFVVYRVRPIGLQVTGNTRTFVDGEWSFPESGTISLNAIGYTPGTSIFSNQISVSGHTQNMNWQTVTVFAEQGKKSHQLAYYDGTMRNRQSLALNNQENQFIVGQTIFDHVGRPAVQTMPVPDVMSPSSACYKYAFNQTTDPNRLNTQYNWQDFDLMADINAGCADIKVNSMSSASGAAQYYSANNPVQNSFNAMIPDAEGYPFMQVEYTPDNTGRIARQSGVGKAHRLTGEDETSSTINAHETEYFYTAPAQNQLDRLFGNEIGDALHYKRNIVKDANGQHSVSYIDPYGRTVATALAGSSSSSPNLDPLTSSGTTHTVTHQLEPKNNRLVNDALVTEKSFHKTIQGDVKITYEMTPPTFTQTNCNEVDLCFTCDYVLELSLKNNCGVEYIPVANQVQNVGTLDETTWQCNGNVQFINQPSPLTINVPAGEYTFVKKLKLNKETEDRYTNNYLSSLNGGCIKTYEQFLQEEIAAIEDKFCDYDCAQCELDLTSMNTQKTNLENIIANLNEGPEKTDKEKELEELIGEIAEQDNLCNALCNGTNLCESAWVGMTMDVRPGGQFMPLLKTDQNGIVSQFSDQTTKADAHYQYSILLIDNNLNGSQDHWKNPAEGEDCANCGAVYADKTGKKPAYVLIENGLPEQESGALYYDENGAHISNPSSYSGKLYILVHQLKYATDFLKYYADNPHWANQLVQFHPDYICWKQSCGNETGESNLSEIYTYENLLSKVATSTEADQKGLYNPMNYTEGADNKLPSPVVTPISGGNISNTYNGPTLAADKDPLQSVAWMSSDVPASNPTITWAERFKEILSNHNSVTVNNSIWQVMVKQSDAMTTTAQEKICWSDMDWLLFRSLYISSRQQLISEYIESQKIQSQTICPGVLTKGTQTNYSTRFIYKPAQVNNTAATTTAVEGAIATQCTEQCESYADRWVKELSQCQDFASLLANTTYKDLLVARLVKVCEGGCDGNSPFGAINVSPANQTNASYPDKNIEQAIRNWLKTDVGSNQESKFVPGVCDDLLITFPHKYGHDYLATADPDAGNCACEVNKTPGVPRPSNCPENHGTTLDPNDCACKMTKSEAKKIMLATQALDDDMLCKNCISCQCMTDVLRTFTKKYTHYHTWTEDQLKKTCEIYFNRELGFNLIIDEYISFLRECSGNATGTLLTLIQDMEKRYMASNIPSLNPIKSIQAPKGNQHAQSILPWSGQTHSIQSLANNWTPFPEVNTLKKADLLVSTGMMPPPPPYTQSQADAIACGCEKILQAWYAYENETKEYTSITDAYTDIFGPMSCPGVNITAAAEHCLELFGMGNKEQGKIDYHPTLRFNTTKKSFIQTLEIGNHPNTLDNLADCPCDNGDLKTLDCCACKKLMEEELLYQAAYPNQSISYAQFLKNKFPNTSSPMPGYEELLAKCKKFWEDGAGEDANGNAVQWTSGQDPCANPITKNNTITNAVQNDLLLPKELGCDPNPNTNIPETDPDLPPSGSYKKIGTSGASKVYITPIDCNILTGWAEDYLSNNAQPSISGLPLSGGCDDPILKIIASYEKMRSEKVQNIADPGVVTWFDDFYTQMKSNFMGAPHNKPADYASIEQLIQQLWLCADPCSTPTYSGPCKGTDDCNKCYEVNTDYLAAFELYLNQVVNNVGHSSYDPNNNPIRFIYINNELKITGGGISYNKVGATNWNLQSSVRTVDKYYNSVLYPASGFQNLLKYYLTNHDLTHGHKVEVNNSPQNHSNTYSMNFPKDARQNNLGEIVSFADVALTKPMACYYPTKYNITAYQIVRKKYSDLEGVEPLMYLGQPLFYYQKVQMYGYFDTMVVEPKSCFNPCAQLCNRPFLPVAEVRPDPCKELLMENARYNAELRYRKHIKKQEEEFRSGYREKCLNPLQELATIEYDDYEYHHTLYYYDQAGNLIKTVPPAGVRYLTPAQETQARTHRGCNTCIVKVTPDHEKITNYQYNTLNQVVQQHTPDGGKSKFWYDQLGRIVISQNAKQAFNNLGYYSYTLYDGLGRPIEVGELKRGSAMNNTIASNPTLLSNWINVATQRRQVTRTTYDESISTTIAGLFSSGDQENLRNRVSSTFYQLAYNSSATVYDHASHYSYDIHGNVNELIQDVPALEPTGNRYKTIAYAYDLLSGNVNKVSYQKAKEDQMIHRYTYDKNNRLEFVESSTNGLHWEKDAKYQYYKHGPMARTELGQLQVQGLDYTYTLHGWIKGVNAQTLNPNNDPGEDGKQGGVNQYIARDAFGFGLNFYDDGVFDDYKPINGSKANVEATKTSSDVEMQLQGKSLYNGNISHMATAIPNATSYSSGYAYVNQTIGNVYRYDQLNRLVMMQSFDNLNSSSNQWQNNGYDGSGKYHTQYSYDADGNLQSLKRNGHLFAGPNAGNIGQAGDMDQLTYNYMSHNNTSDPYYNGEQINRLEYVSDNQAAPTTTYTEDIESQNAGNYAYDAIGNLTKDIKEGIEEITWNVYGKIEKIKRYASNLTSPELEFGYDATGQRLWKMVKPRASGNINIEPTWVKTYYIRDPQGNVMGTYEMKYEHITGNTYKETVTLKEQSLYGSARLGIESRNIATGEVELTHTGWNADYSFNNKTYNMATSNGPTDNNLGQGNQIIEMALARGHKQYELANHLGNVLATITDRKINQAVSSSGAMGISFYEADMVSINDYYPFGMAMGDRKYASNSYKYGFNGQEKDDEVSGEGNSMTAEFWQYDARLGRRFNVDPKAVVSFSPYLVMGANPLFFVDPKGDTIRIHYNYKDADGSHQRGYVTYTPNMSYDESLNNEFVKNVITALNYIVSNNLDFGNLVTKLAKSPYTTIIYDGEGNKGRWMTPENGARSHGGVYEINWNAKKGLVFRNSLGGLGQVSPALALLHELGHIYAKDIVFGAEEERKMGNTPDSDYDNKIEKWVITKVENYAVIVLFLQGNAKMLLNIRNNHSGSLILWGGVTNEVGPGLTKDEYLKVLKDEQIRKDEP